LVAFGLGAEPSSFSAARSSPQKVRQLGDVAGNPSRLIAREQLGR
jgi:hypothetical protein